MKTLKNLPCSDNSEYGCCEDSGISESPHSISVDDLKEAAKEWIEKLKEEKCNSTIDEENFPVKNDCPNWFEIEDDTYYSHCLCSLVNKTKIKFIENFFNIGEK